ncbi:DUF2867 domain-containing protein, partial [Nocardia sp. NPDC060220]|uniref:DUF2867 domain-containing protein n=1 Tax=Nocardia sp. NPDC060220 TaxID=3347076 RepID=UPI00365F7431
MTIRTGGVESIGVGEHRRITVGRGEEHDDEVTGRDGDIRELDGLAGDAGNQLDRLVGGVGLRRGRRDAQHLRVGESLDFWRVEEIEQGHLLR